MCDPTSLAPQERLSLVEQYATALAQQMHIDYEEAHAISLTMLRTEVLNELMNGDWYDKENGMEILQERLKNVDLEELFHGFYLNPAIGPQGFLAMLSERFPWLGPNAKSEETIVVSGELEETNE